MLMLKSLKERMRQKGYRLEVTDDLVSYVAIKGYDPKFGARPMRRIIQDVLEERIATKIISGSIQKGAVVILNTEDMTE